MVGKLPPSMLLRYVFTRVGARDPAVLVGPSIGEDAAVIDLGDGRVLVAHVDPITGAVEHIGWLAVHIACNDVAVRGARPRWLLPVLYLPEGSGEELVDRVTREVDEAAREVGAMVVGGHSEFTPGLARPLISMTALGVADKSRLVTTGGARPGDHVLMTKTAGLEGTAILATDFAEVLAERGVPPRVLERARGFIRMVSVLREALALADEGLATSMHDPTEGGLLGGLAEIAYASGVTVEVWGDRVPVAEETAEVSRALGVDPLRLISSGTLVATVPGDAVGRALEVLEAEGVRATVIGRARERAGRALVVLRGEEGVEEVVEEPYVADELTRVWELWGERVRGG